MTPPSDTKPSSEESELVRHARRELERIGQFKEDREFAESIVKAVEAFASYGHSGGSAGVGIHMLYDLLQYKPLSPLSDDPAEWMRVDPEHLAPGLWQSRRRPDAFSSDGGKTYKLVDDPYPWWRKLLRLGRRRYTTQPA